MNIDMMFLFMPAVAACVIGCTEIPPVTEGPDDGDKEKPDTVHVVPPVPCSVKWSDLLDEMVSYDGFTRWPETGYSSRQESSRDRRSTDPSDPMWFANDDGWGYERFEFPEGRTEKVIFDERHPGVITRMWLTSFGSPETIVRFYFDGAEEPSWTMDSYNLKNFGAYAGVSLGDGLAQPSAAWIRGSSMYLPVSWARSCKITIEELVEPTTVSRYYHINYRRYEDDVQVQTLTPALLRQNNARLRTLSSGLLSPEAVAGDRDDVSVALAAGSGFEYLLPDGMKSLDELSVTVSAGGHADLAQVLQGLVVEGFFDGTRTVAVPLAYLAGAGTGGYYVKSWRFESNGRGKFTVRWKMPWKNSAKLVFHNMSDHDVSVDVSSVTNGYMWDSRSLYFHAAYKRAVNFPIRYWSDYANGVEWNFATIVGGRGIYVGDVYCIDNATSEWPGEGDEKIWVDNEAFPSHFGTGVEDYYSFCGYFKFHTPFSGEPRLDANNFNGINVHYRTRNLDVIPFKSKLVFNLEMEGHAAGTADLENAVFWYGDASTKATGTEEYDF